MATSSSLRLALADREEISLGLVAGDSLRDIAARLHRAPSTISREVAASATSGRYRAWRADAAATAQRSRPKARKLETNARLLAAVEHGLARRSSTQ